MKASKNILIFAACGCTMIFSTLNIPADASSQEQIKDDTLTRNTTLGVVLGEERQNPFTDNEKYYSFHGIPYAAAPIDNLRFKAPEWHQQYEEPFDASDENNYKCCPQLIPDVLCVNEDCLMLSVYTPQAKASSSTELPVVVWIHGGGFTSGCGMFPINGPERIMMGNDVVVVSINYRLGMLGFLSLANNQLTGNMGLLDQVMALQWVRDNIRNFGGDPGRVTIMGESAGSWSVFYHMMSPLSKDLFQQVIGQSGAVVSPAYREYSADEARRWGQKSASAVGCPDTGVLADQVECLQKVEVNELLISPVQGGFNGAQAVIDGSFSGLPFLPLSPKDIMEEGEYNSNVNILLGSNRDEGLLFLYAAIENNTLLEEAKGDWRDWYGAFMILGVEPGMQDADDLEALDTITNFYLGDLENMNIQHIHNIIEMYTDAWFSFGVHDFITRHFPYSKQHSILQYLYVHEGEHSFTAIGPYGSYGVCHADETYLQFSPNVMNQNGLNAADTRVSQTLLTLWKNFMKKGDASTEELIWNPISEGENGQLDRRYLRLTYAESSYMEYSKNWEERMTLWDEVINGRKNTAN